MLTFSDNSFNPGFKLMLLCFQDPYGVAVGGTVGHCLCTGLAVIGGRMIAQKISVRTGTFCFSFNYKENAMS